MSEHRRLVEREVRADDPRLSPEANRALSDLVEQYAPDRPAHGAAEVVSSGNNRVSAEPADDALRAGVEQQSALTPAGSPVTPAGRRGAPMLLPIIAVVGSVAVGVLAAVFSGGVAWVGAAVLVGSAAAWLVLQLRMADRAEEDSEGRADRATGDSRRPRRTLLAPTIVIVTGAVVAGVIIVGAIGGYL